MKTVLMSVLNVINACNGAVFGKTFNKVFHCIIRTYSRPILCLTIEPCPICKSYALLYSDATQLEKELNGGSEIFWILERCAMDIKHGRYIRILECKIHNITLFMVRRNHKMGPCLLIILKLPYPSRSELSIS